METNKLGKFLSAVEIDGSTFHIRGLTVGEYCDLVLKMNQEDLKRDSERWTTIVTNTGLVDWENIYDTDNEELPFSEEYREYLPDEIFTELADKIFNDLTVLSKDERDKFAASTRFLYYASEAKNSSVADTFSCEVCIKKGLAKNRTCGRFSNEQIDDLAREFRGQGENVSETPVIAQKDVKSKYKTARNRVKTNVAAPAPEIVEEDTDYVKTVERRVGVVLDGFKYPECPVSYIDDWISVLTGMLYHAGKSNLSFFDGGVVDQPYKLLQAQKVVSGEANKIESEEMEKDRKESEKKSKRK